MEVQKYDSVRHLEQKITFETGRFCSSWKCHISCMKNRESIFEILLILILCICGSKYDYELTCNM